MYPGSKYRKENNKPNNNQGNYPSNNYNQNSYPPNNYDNQNSYPPNNQGGYPQNAPNIGYSNGAPSGMPMPSMDGYNNGPQGGYPSISQGNFNNPPSNFPTPNYDAPPNFESQFRPNQAPQPTPHHNTQPINTQIPQGQPIPAGNDRNINISTCKGNKKALMIGINYFGQRGQLRGCINDVKNIKNFICKHYGFREEDMVILTDDQKDPKFIPTKANMISAMKWLVMNAQPNDSLFFHFSGHGGQVEDLDGDEDDGYDETILPVDHQKAGVIVDDEMNLIMVRPLSTGTRLTAVFDSCHSGTALDLPYVYGTDGKLKSFNPVKTAMSSLGNAGKSYMAGDMMKTFGALKSGLSMFTKGKKAEKISTETRSTMGDVVMFSGCKDRQTSADATISGVGNTGAMSHALISCLGNNPYGYTYHQLLLDLRQFLKNKYSQLPVLSTGRPMDINSKFIM